MHAHVVVGVEVDVRDVVARVTDEYVTPIVDDEECIVVRRVAVRMGSRYRAPIGIAMDVVDGVGAIIGDRRSRRRVATTDRIRAIGRGKKATRHGKKGNNKR